MLIFIAASYLSAVLFPDLALGGSRSHHVRYALPGVLALHLMVPSDYGISAGELISLAYLLDDRVRIWGEKNGKAPTLPAGFGETIALTPSVELKSLLEQDHKLVSAAETWQWIRATPRPRPTRSTLDYAER